MPDVIEILQDAILPLDILNRPEVAQSVEQGSRGPAGMNQAFQFSLPGPLVAPYVSEYNFVVPWASVVDLLIVSTSTAPVGAPLIMDVKRNNVSLFPGGVGRPTVAVGQVIGSGTVGQTLVANDILKFSITSVGTGATSLLLLLNLVRS